MQASSIQSYRVRNKMSPCGSLPNVDSELSRRLNRLSSGNPEFWTFSHGATPRDAHAFYRYPAMMVPAMQRELLKIILDLQPGIIRAIDPFAGSGTVMVEGILAGISMHAQDINPLAILLCRTKVSVFDYHALADAVYEILAIIQNDKSKSKAVDFPGREKWFTDDAHIKLSRIRRAILSVKELWIRRFLWVSLAETARTCSNSRTSTYKLHIRPQHEFADLPDPIWSFAKIAEMNLKRYSNFTDELNARNLLSNKALRTSSTVLLRDSREIISGKFDLLITSPPYGDNRTTVPYGQNSYLPLQWIPSADIDSDLDSDYLRSTYEIDRRSLGGVNPRVNLEIHYRDVLLRSDALLATVRRLNGQPRDRLSRVLSFVNALDQSISVCADALNANAYSFWTLGNRRVGGIEIELDCILAELAAGHGLKLIQTIERRIHSKRMAIRNRMTNTMRTEKVVILRKQGRT